MYTCTHSYPILGVGDFVNADDVVVILETDKVSVDVRAPESGEILEIFAEEGGYC